jgi:hypothetical protein
VTALFVWLLWAYQIAMPLIVRYGRFPLLEIR